MVPNGYANLRGRMRVCVVYDCLYPYTVGGAERWYRNLADELVAARPGEAGGRF